MKTSTFKRTKLSCYLGVFTQAMTSNLTAILYVPLMTLYNLSFVHLGILVAVFFVSQVFTDLIFSSLIDKLGYRKLVLPACVFSFLGVVMFALAPFIFGVNIFAGIAIATVIFAFSCGLMEIMLSPMIVAIPDSNRSKSTGHLHAMYAWGQVATIVITTLLIFLLGNKYWQIVVAVWALVPLAAFVLFYGAPFPEITPEHKREKAGSIFKNPFFIFALLAIFFGAGTEVTMNQWISTFLDRGIGLPKIAGDLLGMCGFAVMMGVGRSLFGALGHKIRILRVLLFSSIFSLICYVTVVFVPSSVPVVIACVVCGLGASLLWPGIIVAAGERFPLSGAWMFAILALAGDLGAAFAPYVTGQVTEIMLTSPLAESFSALLGITSEQAALRLGLLSAAIFPLLTIVCHTVMLALKRRKAIKCSE